MRHPAGLWFSLVLLSCSPPPEAVPPTAPPPDPPPVASEAPAASSAALTPEALSAGLPAGEDWRDPTKEKPSDPKNLCEVANANIRKAIDEVLAQSPTKATAGNTPWDHRSKLLHEGLIEGRFALRAKERTMLRKNGFVVPERLTHPSYAHAYHDIYQSQLPVFVTMDSLFHAIFVGNEHLLMALEEKVVSPALHEAVGKLQGELKKQAASLPKEIGADLDLYLAVAQALLSGTDAPSGSAAAALVERARKADGLIEVSLFGRPRMIDFSQFRPRGPYATREHLHDHFRAVMWLARLEFNLVSRSSRSSAPGTSPDPTETPREAMAAVALAELVVSSGAADELRKVERVWGGVAGKREDVGMGDLLARWKKTGLSSLADPGAFAALKSSIGQDFQRTARVHYMPQGSPVLPAISTMLGPRITPDTAATRPLVHGEVNGRYELGVADIAYALGHDGALSYLKKDLKEFPELRAALGKARDVAQRIDGDDLYASWLKAIRALTKSPQGVVPSFSSTAAFRDLRMNSVVASYGQLRRNNVLLVGQSYDEGGCEIPDGYVEPAPEALEQLLAYVSRARSLIASFDQATRDSLKEESAMLERSERIFTALLAIVRRQLAGVPLTEPERRFLATVTEIIPGSSDGPPRHTGWYFQLFPWNRDALASPAFVGDFYTSSNTGKVTYAGAGEPSLGIFVVDAGGAPRLMVGPVAQSFELRAPLDKRLTDTEASKVEGKTAAWRGSFAVAAARPPRISVDQDSEEEGALTFRVEHPDQKTLQPANLTIELLSHHRQPCARGSGFVGAKGGKVKLKRLLKSEEPCPSGGLRITLNGEVFTSLVPWGSAYFGEYTPDPSAPPP